MLTSDQIRAARGLLHWSARRLAAEAGVHLTTVQRMERSNGTVRGRAETVFQVQQALETAGVEFLFQDGGSGVRMRPPED